MRAIILAAGRGERMRPLTDNCPKPLLCVRGKPLIEFHIEALAAAGVRDIVINTAWLSEQFPATLGDGSRFGLRLHFSDESGEPVGALETAGGIARALPLLGADGGEAFWVVAGDVFLPDFRFPQMAAERFLHSDLDAHLWLTHNSPHHPKGDFGISAEGLALADTASPRYTWASVGLFRRRLFEAIAPGTKAALRPVLEDAIRRHKLSAELLNGRWLDVGTAERLASLQD
ncbi:N-acetylmuramate alpha-1-phosphate uridylyltransferase MurU [Roseateles oligotrophus]|uniref:Nucleotidyltransferase family protein n=1 Tax=Roseateles oligotrophus TaxID=1769250 RepID=A0ABT2YJW2_9BURK|nr:nucleotidyltransferase family protein [Roseateles oligotrophus]MCV2370355.1 nucleotidyltransferase family protein [Roseateles oligotrophus]